MRLRHALLVIPLMLGTPADAKDRPTFQDLRFDGVTRQGAEPSCGTASLATLLHAEFGVDLDGEKLWIDYLGTLSKADFAKTLDLGLSMQDIVQVARSLGFQAVSGTIDLMGLHELRSPAILYTESRGGPEPFRHFIVFMGLDGPYAKLRDPIFGNRKVRIEQLLKDWTGDVILIPGRL